MRERARGKKKKGIKEGRKKGGGAQIRERKERERGKNDEETG